MIGVAHRAGLAGVETIQLEPAMAISEVWSSVQEACGIGPQELASRVAENFKLGPADLSSAEPHALKLVPESVARKGHVFPLREDDRRIVVATADPTDLETEQALGFASGRKPVMEVAPPDALEEAITAHYSPDRAVENLLKSVDAELGESVRLVEQTKAEGATEGELEGGPVVQLTNMILRDAIRQGASDIHIQPSSAGGAVRFRIDGLLRHHMQMPLPALNRVVSRIKILGQMDIADRLRPQDGRARIGIGSKTYDLRISTVPTRESEKAVIRILDPEGSGTLSNIGLRDIELGRFRRLLTNREGIIVVTGPTGSGKTTTLYGALKELATEDVNIMTVEDPVEYELPGLTQIQVEPKQGVTFASALRAILRQDPDVIFVGEIRDLETAGIAVQASMTGHLVLATLHTNDAVGVFRRLTDLGLDRASIVETLRGAVGQRLARRICSNCAAPIAGELTESEARLAAVYRTKPRLRAPGCDQCGQTGYRGRLPLVEVLTMGGELEDLVLQDAAPRKLQAAAVTGGMRPFRKVAAESVRNGDTTLDELERVLGDVGEAEEQTSRDQILADIKREQLQPPTASPSEPWPYVAAPAVPAPTGFGQRPIPTPSPTTSQPIPAHSATPTQPPPTQPPRERWEEEEHKTHVLVVDDDGVNRTIARALLERDGYRVSEASDGAVALELLKIGGTYDLMVLDLDMPYIGGREVLKHVRASVATAGLPVVVLTGTTDPDAEIQLMEEGADDYIRKPIDPPRFAVRVKATLRRASI